MTVSILYIAQPSPTRIDVYVSSTEDPATFYPWKNGEAMAPTEVSPISFTVSPFEQPQLDIFDDAGDTPNFYPDSMTAQWNARTNATGYRVYEYISTAWLLRQDIIALGQPVFRWQSRRLEDGQTHLFKVVPYDANGNDGDAWQISFPMIRPPDHDVLALAYDSGTTKVTIDDA